MILQQTQDAFHEAPVEVAIVQRVPIEKMKLGELVMLVKDGCKAVVDCLMARRITEQQGADVATKPYGRPIKT
jgi:hypothetical protein